MLKIGTYLRGDTSNAKNSVPLVQHNVHKRYLRNVCPKQACLMVILDPEMLRVLLLFITAPVLAYTCCNEIGVDRYAIYDLVWDIYDYVKEDRANRDSLHICAKVSSDRVCTTLLLTGHAQMWGRRPNGTVAEQARRDPANGGDSFHSAKINVTSVRYSSCDDGIVFKRKNVISWESELCHYLKNLGGKSPNKRYLSPAVEGRSCYILTETESLSALFGTADYISQPGNVKAGFRMALHSGDARVYCSTGSIDFNGEEPFGKDWPPCRHVALPVGNEEIGRESWLSD